MELTFRIAKLMDCSRQDAMANTGGNPFAVIASAHLESLTTRHSPASRQSSKLMLVKSLLRRDMPKEDIRQLFRLIDWMMTLPEDLEEAFRREIHRFEEENKMEYLSSIERIGYKKGLDEGRQEGRQVGLLEGIELALETKFGARGRKLMKKVKSLGELSALRQFAKFVKKAATFQKVHAYLEEAASND
jgi:flagellar biosynthesis/type III secretory pathway protein FliH